MKGEANSRSTPSPPVALGWLRNVVIPAKSLPRTRYGAGIRSGFRRLLRLLVEPIGPRHAGAMPSGRRGHVPVRGAWESACGWEARWNAWLASPSGPMWRGDGEEPHRPRG